MIAAAVLIVGTLALVGLLSRGPDCGRCMDRGWFLDHEFGGIPRECGCQDMDGRKVER